MCLSGPVPFLPSHSSLVPIFALHVECRNAAPARIRPSEAGLDLPVPAPSLLIANGGPATAVSCARAPCQGPHRSSLQRKNGKGNVSQPRHNCRTAEEGTLLWLSGRNHVGTVSGAPPGRPLITPPRALLLAVRPRTSQSQHLTCCSDGTPAHSQGHCWQRRRRWFTNVATRPVWGRRCRRQSRGVQADPPHLRSFTMLPSHPQEHSWASSRQQMGKGVESRT